MGKLEWRLPDSTAVARYAYDEAGQWLYVVFRSDDRLYRYLRVPPDEISRLEAADSLGESVNTAIKPNYDGERREPDGRWVRVPRVGTPRG
jgi:hypothetical protein